MAPGRGIECARVIESKANTAIFEGKRFYLNWERMMATRSGGTTRVA